MKPRARSIKIAGAEATAFLLAAHALTEAAWVVVDKTGRSWSATLIQRPGAPVVDLAATFRAAYETERLRAAIERAGRPLRAERLRRLLALDGAVAAATPAPALSLERLAEIEALLAEDAAQRSTGPGEHSVRTPWEDLRRK
jgi:hypothetical protein